MGGPTQDFVQSMLSFKSDFKVVLHFSALVFLGLGHLRCNLKFNLANVSFNCKIFVFDVLFRILIPFL